MTNKKAYDAVVRARTVLIVSSPFFGCLALQLEIVEVNNAAQVDTMAVDGRHLYYHPPFVLKLSEEELVGVVAHETMHCVYSHFSRRGHRDASKWNISGDFRINWDLKQVPFVLPGQQVGIKDFGTGKSGHLYDAQFANMSTEEIYEKIPDPPKQPSGGNGRQDPGGCGAVLDAGAGPGSEQDKAAAKGLAAATAHEWEANVRMAVSVARAANAGATPGYLERLVTQLKRPKVSWRDVTRQFIDQSMSRDYSYARPNRRALATGLLLPGFIPDALHELVMVVDCSGSISDEMMRSYVSEVAGALDDGTTDKLTVMYADDGVRCVDEYVQGDVVKCKTLGAGGTNFDPSFKWIAENAPDASCVIYLTDMETSSFGKEPNCPVLWGCYTTEECFKNLKPPFGSMLLVESPE